MNGPAQGSLVLGFQPSSHGFGWIAFSTPFAIHDWGIPDVPRGTKNESSLRKLEGLLDRLEPYLLVLEAFEQRSTRIARLCQSVVALARSRGIDVAVYTKGQIEECFRSVGAKTRHEVASAIARSFDMLRADLPAKRKAWEPAPKNALVRGRCGSAHALPIGNLHAL